MLHPILLKTVFPHLRDWEAELPGILYRRIEDLQLPAALCRLEKDIRREESEDGGGKNSVLGGCVLSPGLSLQQGIAREKHNVTSLVGGRLVVGTSRLRSKRV